MRKISITQALNELKLYNEKILKAIEKVNLVGYAKKSFDKIGVLTKDEFSANCKADYQSLTDIIANRNYIKSAIVKSNAVTEVKIGEKAMTVAEAIERKASIQYDELLLDKMKAQYAAATSNVERENKRVDAKVDELIATLVGKDSQKKLSEDDQRNVEIPYRKANEYELVDPLNLNDKIKKLEAEIDDFKSNVDTALSISNATTFVEVDF